MIRYGGVSSPRDARWYAANLTDTLVWVYYSPIIRRWWIFCRSAGRRWELPYAVRYAAWLGPWDGLSSRRICVRSTHHHIADAERVHVWWGWGSRTWTGILYQLWVVRVYNLLFNLVKAFKDNFTWITKLIIVSLSNVLRSVYINEYGWGILCIYRLLRYRVNDSNYISTKMLIVKSELSVHSLSWQTVLNIWILVTW